MKKKETIRVLYLDKYKFTCEAPLGVSDIGSYHSSLEVVLTCVDKKFQATYSGGIKDYYSKYEFHGFSSLVLLDGTQYVGEWTYGKRNGSGTYKSADGSRYEGDFQYNKFHGHGKLFYLNGDTYEGDFNLHKKQGTGTEYIAKSKYFFNGIFKDGKLDKLIWKVSKADKKLLFY